ncbi:vWA domain-containing protein [uncultured Corynebacterium sp.]|uniref:vWA domain-containing protein n=1 Tax=uncultured Corynebacterium sp. TaxID=159447 RepID=UPI0025EA6903|nr:vWA domain-containing protein [uncultured Corynebacterium sp.]
MGRHSTGKNNYSLSKEVIALLVAIALVIAAVVAWLFLRDNGENSAADEQAECVSGDLRLPVSAASKSVGEQLIDDYAASNPVVRDYCVKPEYVDSIEEAAVYVAPVSPVTTEELSAADRSSTTNDPVAVYASPVGTAAADAAAPALETVLFPTGEQPETSAIVAQALAENDETAAKALTEQRVQAVTSAVGEIDKAVATTEDAAPEGFTFTALDGKELVYAAFPLNTTDEVNEEETRAAQAFSDYSGKMFIDAHGEADTNPADVSEPVWSAAKPQGGKRITDPQAVDADQDIDDSAAAGSPSEPNKTLFLLDTSANMSEFNDPAAEVIDAAVGDITGAGHEVALWNYSSPLTPGVTKGYRGNVAFTGDADSVTGTAHRFINDGQPQTREAVGAAVAYAETEATTDAPVRIVLITSGSADAADEYAVQALDEAKDKGVSLSIVRVGDGDTDDELADAAEFTTDASTPDDLDAAIRAAAGLK